MKILYIGDVVGKPGRVAIQRLLPRLCDRHQLDLVVANGENAAGGVGTSTETAQALLDLGIAVLSGGNHTWRHKDFIKMLAREPRVLRPLNFPRGTPGRGFAVAETPGGEKVGVISLQGRIFMEPLPTPFEAVEPAIAEIREQTPVILVDFHAEATSEKRAMGWYLDGKVSAVLGTHTHVQTADEEILPQGTAYISDLGMTGPHDSIIGMRKDNMLQRFLTMRPQSFEVAKHDLRLCGVVLDIDAATGKARSIVRLQERLES